MSSTDDPSRQVPAAYYDAASGALVVGGHPDLPGSGLRTGDAAILREASRWTTGQRGEPVDLTEHDGIDLSQFAREALGVGSRVLAIAAQASDTAAVQQAVREATEQVDAAVSRAVRTAEESVARSAESLVRTAQQVQQTLTGEVQRLVGGESPELLARLQPLLQQIGASVQQQVGEGMSATTEALARATHERHAELTGLMQEVRKDVAVRVAADAAAVEATAAVKAGTTIKGFDYEEQAHSVCHEVAAALGAEYREVGENAGRLPRNKKGDGLFCFDGDLARVVVEMHDGTSKDWGSYLAEAERNRNAQASIGLVKSLSDNAGHVIRVIAPKRIIVAFDPTETDEAALAQAVDILRTSVLLMKTVAMTSSGRFGVEEIGTANEAIREALTLIDDLDEAKRSASAITGHVEKIEKTIGKTMTAVQRELHKATNALTGAAADAGTEAEAGAATDLRLVSDDADGAGDEDAPVGAETA